MCWNITELLRTDTANLGQCRTGIIARLYIYKAVCLSTFVRKGWNEEGDLARDVRLPRFRTTEKIDSD
jgi:hypothetical protein